MGRIRILMKLILTTMEIDKGHLYLSLTHNKEFLSRKREGLQQVKSLSALLELVPPQLIALSSPIRNKKWSRLDITER